MVHTDGDVEVEPQRNEFATKVIVMANGGAIVGTATDTSYATNPWELVVESPDTKDQTSADALAASILAAQLVEWKKCGPTPQTGLRPGMHQTITLAARGVNNSYLVTEVNIEDGGGYALRRVRATEGVAYKTGWRSRPGALRRQVVGRQLAGVAMAAAGDPFLPLRAALASSTQSPTPDWVDASPMEVTVDTVPRGTLGRCDRAAAGARCGRLP